MEGVVVSFTLAVDDLAHIHTHEGQETKKVPSRHYEKEKRSEKVVIAQCGWRNELKMTGEIHAGDRLANTASCLRPD